MKQYGPRYHVKPRRHRQGKTDYRKRLSLLKSRKPRIVVRKTLKYIHVQFVDYSSDGDKVLASAISKELVTNYKWKHALSTTPAAYLTGLLAGAKAKEKGISEGVFDIGRYRATKGNKLFAALKGVLDAGVSCPHDEAMIPSEERILGAHLDAKLSSQVSEIKEKIAGGT